MSHGRRGLGHGNSWHHIFHQASWYDYRIPLEREFREHPGLVVPMRDYKHNELHRNLDPPLKPNQWQMERVVGTLALWLPSDGRLSGVEATIDAFIGMSEEDGWIARNAGAIALNLEQQLDYMQAGAPVRSSLHRASRLAS